MKHKPFVSILIVNYNGRHLLGECLSSVFSLSYPRNSYEVIVVDNNSSDDSVSFILKNYPDTQVVKSEENLGFTGGNNLGYSKAKGEYIVLLNSDVRVESDWLNALVECAKDPKVGIVSSRLRYAMPFVELTIDSNAVPKSKVFITTDHSPIGPLLEDIVTEPSSLSCLVNYKSGFYDRKVGEISTRRSSGKSSVMLPIDLGKEVNTFSLTLHGFDSVEPIALPVKILICGKVHSEIILQSYEAKQIVLKINQKDLQQCFSWHIQNAGNVVLANGYGKDRGSVVVARDSERSEFYEEESSYFEKKVELLAACGASCLIKRAVFDNVGLLDGYYFMYYEDMEFSMRAWRAGWKIIYEPKSIGYHRHRATTGSEESAFFLAQVERNHLAFVITHFSVGVVLRETYFFLLRYGITTLKFLLFQFMDNEFRADVWRQKFEGRRIAFKYIVSSFFRLLKNRMDLNKYWPINRREMRKMTY